MITNIGNRSNSLINYPNKAVDTFKAKVLASGGIFENENSTREKVKSLDSRGLLKKSSLTLVPSGYSQGKLNSLRGDDFNVVRNSTATRVNELGLIETVAANVPRIDYTDGVGSLLLEPQMTNLLTNSDNLDIQFSKSDVELIGGFPSPDNTSTAYKVLAKNIGDRHFLNKTGVGKGETTYTFSFFTKKVDYNFTQIILGGEFSNLQANIDLSNGSISNNNIGDVRVTGFNNDWYRISATRKLNLGPSGREAMYWVALAPVPESTTSRLGDFISDGLKGNLIWGAQLEEGPYPTSYIPTTSTAVTRVKDVISTPLKVSANSNSGTIYLNYTKFNPTNENRIGLYDEVSWRNSLNIVFSGNTVSVRYYVDGVSPNPLQTTVNFLEGDRLAYSWSKNRIALFLNGTLLKSSNITGQDWVLSKFNFSNESGSSAFEGKVHGLQLFDKTLTDSECIALTS